MSKPPAKKAAAAFERGPEWRYFGFPEFEENDAAAAAAANGGALTKPPKKIPRVRCMYCHEKISARSNSLRRHLRECTKCTDEARQYCVKIDKMNFPVEPPPPSAPSLDDEHVKGDSSAFGAPSSLRPSNDNPNLPQDAATGHDQQDGDDPTNKATQRRLKNRLACRANRKRKKAIRETLKMQVKQLSRSNSWLHQEINALLGYSLESSSAPATSSPRSSPQASSRHLHQAYDPLAESTRMHDTQAPPRAADPLPDAAAKALVTVDASARPSSPWENKENAVAHVPVSQQRVSRLQETAAAFFRWFVGVSDQREADSSPFYSQDDCEVVGERATFCDTFHVGPHVSLEAIWKTKAYLFDDLHAVQDVHVAAAGDVVTVTIVEEGVLRDVWALRALFNPTFVVTLQLHFANSTPKVQLSWELVCHCDVAQASRPAARRIEVALIKCDRL